MSVKCEKASVYNSDSNDDDDAAAAVNHDDAHDHASFFSFLDDVALHHFSCELHVSTLWSVYAVNDSDSDDEDLPQS